MLIIDWKNIKKWWWKSKMCSDNMTIHACMDNSCFHCCQRNFCILTGLLACDNSHMHRQFMPRSIVVIENSAFWLAYKLWDNCNCTKLQISAQNYKAL